MLIHDVLNAEFDVCNNDIIDCQNAEFNFNFTKIFKLTFDVILLCIKWCAIFQIEIIA